MIAVILFEEKLELDDTKMASDHFEVKSIDDWSSSDHYIHQILISRILIQPTWQSMRFKPPPV